MLARASEFFEKLFQRDGLDTGEVRLEETTPEEFPIILKCIYSEDEELFKNLEYKTILKIVQNANMWLISDVERIGIYHLKIKAKDLDPEILIELYAEFYLLNNHAFMKDIIYMMKKILNFQVPLINLFRLELNCFKDFLKRSEEVLFEGPRFSMAEKWIQKIHLQIDPLLN